MTIAFIILYLLTAAAVYAGVFHLCLLKGFRNGKIIYKKSVDRDAKGAALVASALFPIAAVLVLYVALQDIKRKWDKAKHRHYFSFKGRTVYVDKRGDNGQYVLTEKGNFVSNDYRYEEYMNIIRTQLHPEMREEYTKIMLEEVLPYLQELERTHSFL